MVKNSFFDTCGGDCLSCGGFGFKNMAVCNVLVKRKVSKKFVPPDMTALKLVLEKEDKYKDISGMTDEELQALEQELIACINNKTNKNLDLEG